MIVGESQFLSLRKVAEHFGRSEKTIRRWIAEARDGKINFPLPINPPGKKNLWRRSDIEGWDASKQERRTVEYETSNGPRRRKDATHRADVLLRDALKRGLVETVTGSVITTRKSKIESAHVCGYLSAMADVYMATIRTGCPDADDGVLQLLDMIIETYRNKIAANN
ncbi:MAG TPA: hypothetical protein DEB39_14490 [Planctomycetaceae bacterium]|nr:hypothetical protein [Planctomycetaceae bacterium]